MVIISLVRDIISFYSSQVLPPQESAIDRMFFPISIQLMLYVLQELTFEYSLKGIQKFGHNFQENAEAMRFAAIGLSLAA